MSTLDYAGATTTCRSSGATAKDVKRNKLQTGANSTIDQQTYSVLWMEAGMDNSIHILHS